MGQVHNELRRSAIGQALKLALGDTKSDGQLERYSESLQAVIDLWSRPEFALLRGEEPFGAAQIVGAGGAGTFAKVGVFNPAGSGLIVVVTHHLLLPGVAATLELGTNTTVLANANAVISRDRRRTTSKGAVLQFEQSAGVSVNTFHICVAPTNATLMSEIPVILPPGHGFIWRTSDDAASLAGSFLGYQRTAYPGELL